MSSDITVILPIAINLLSYRQALFVFLGFLIELYRNSSVPYRCSVLNVCARCSISGYGEDLSLRRAVLASMIWRPLRWMNGSA